MGRCGPGEFGYNLWEYGDNQPFIHFVKGYFERLKRKNMVIGWRSISAK
jgi:hypothetical protein